MNKIAFLGSGSMTEAIIAGLAAEGEIQKDHILVTNRSDDNRLHYMHTVYGVTIPVSDEQFTEDADVIILAVKPKDAQAALQRVKNASVRKDQLIISVMAGISTVFIQEQLQAAQPVIRAMPNTSAAIRQSATAIAKGAYASEEQLQQAEQLFAAIGTVSVVQEEQLHAVTALSGSGPAYVYYLMEALIEAGAAAGLEEESAKQLLWQTLSGAAAMLAGGDQDPKVLRKNITSAGGTTEAGVEVLELYQVKEAVKACVKAAQARSEEMGSKFTNQ